MSIKRIIAFLYTFTTYVDSLRCLGRRIHATDSVGRTTLLGRIHGQASHPRRRLVFLTMTTLVVRVAVVGRAIARLLRLRAVVMRGNKVLKNIHK